MLDNLNAIVGFVFGTCTDVLALYVGGGILTGVLALWLLRRVSKLFDKLH